MAPELYLGTLAAPAPEPQVTSVSLSSREVALGEPFSIRVTATNRGEQADLQLVSVAFPNATSTGVANVTGYTFKQSPVFIEPGGDKNIGAGYIGPQKQVKPQYPAIEGQSRPWGPGESASMELQVTPEREGRFVVFVKAVGLPHSGDRSHWPQEGPLDQQEEYVSVYEVRVITVAAAANATKA